LSFDALEQHRAERAGRHEPELLVVVGDVGFAARCDETVAGEVTARDITEARFGVQTNR
tara:strand:- start:510 stop:686 length:177 start_codon:yes stop_codon:yes gene_type:complete